MGSPGRWPAVLSTTNGVQVPLLRGKPHPTAKGGCATSDSPTGPECIDLLAAAITEVRGSPELVDAVVRDGLVPTLHARKAGSEQLWKFLDELKGHNMLRLFGIAK